MDIIVIIIVLCAIALSLLVIPRVYGRIPCCPEGKILFVIAHPDDECMFFAPGILWASLNNPTYLLCLCNGMSFYIMVVFNGDVYYTGNYYGQGKVREKEFHKSCATLGIKKEHAILINDPYVDGQSYRPAW